MIHNASSEKHSLEEIVKGLDDTFIASHSKQLYHAVIDRIEKALIERVLERTYGNKYRTARILGINRNTLHSKIKKLGIHSAQWKI